MIIFMLYNYVLVNLTVFRMDNGPTFQQFFSTILHPRLILLPMNWLTNYSALYLVHSQWT
jgi:hypothetical protein